VTLCCDSGGIAVSDRRPRRAARGAARGGYATLARGAAAAAGRPRQSENNPDIAIRVNGPLSPGTKKAA
jgi:hypothetical protein